MYNSMDNGWYNIQHNLNEQGDNTMLKTKYMVLLILSFFIINNACAYTTEGVSNTIGTTNSSNITTGIIQGEGTILLNSVDSKILVNNEQIDQNNTFSYIIGGLSISLLIIGYILYRKKNKQISLSTHQTGACSTMDMDNKSIKEYK